MITYTGIDARLDIILKLRAVHIHIADIVDCDIPLLGHIGKESKRIPISRRQAHIGTTAQQSVLASIGAEGLCHPPSPTILQGSIPAQTKAMQLCITVRIPLVKHGELNGRITPNGPRTILIIRDIECILQQISTSQITYIVKVKACRVVA